MKNPWFSRDAKHFGPQNAQGWAVLLIFAAGIMAIALTRQELGQLWGMEPRVALDYADGAWIALFALVVLLTHGRPVSSKA